MKIEKKNKVVDKRPGSEIFNEEYICEPLELPEDIAEIAKTHPLVAAKYYSRLPNPQLRIRKIK